eukprot:3543423-Rhodomonas_salina.5
MGLAKGTHRVKITAMKTLLRQEACPSIKFESRRGRWRPVTKVERVERVACSELSDITVPHSPASSAITIVRRIAFSTIDSQHHRQTTMVQFLITLVPTSQ